jgi:hypothetical protein
MNGKRTIHVVDGYPRLLRQFLSKIWYVLLTNEVTFESVSDATPVSDFLIQ